MLGGGAGHRALARYMHRQRDLTSRLALEDLVGPPHLAVIALQLLYAGALGGRQAGPLALLGRDLADQADGALSQLRRVPPLGGVGTAAALCHDSIFLKEWSLHRSQDGSVVSTSRSR